LGFGIFAAAKAIARKNLSFQWRPLSFAPHAEANFSQQDSQSSRETVQDHRPRQSVALAIVPAPSAFGQKREAQTASRQNGARPQNGRSASKSQSAVRLNQRTRRRINRSSPTRRRGGSAAKTNIEQRTARSTRFTETPALARVWPPVLLSSPASPHANRAMVADCKDRAGSPA
jgi:hypothetical protein